MKGLNYNQALSWSIKFLKHAGFEKSFLFASVNRKTFFAFHFSLHLEIEISCGDKHQMTTTTENGAKQCEKLAN